MDIVNSYVDVDTLALAMGASKASADTFDMLTMAVNAASRAIDGYCQRRFWLDPEPVARTYEPNNLVLLTLVDDIGSTEGLEVATDSTGDGIFEVPWDPSDFLLTPTNAAHAWPEPRPWTGLRAVGTKVWPWPRWGRSVGQWGDSQWGDANTMYGDTGVGGGYGWLTRLDRVQITARWGWPAVPAAVVQATMIKAARLYQRRDSPQGVAGFGEFGPIRISSREDPDVAQLLEQYRRAPFVVA